MDKDENSSWEYKPGQGSGPAEPAAGAPNKPKDSAKTISWDAVEYIDHQQGAGWYVMMGLLIILIAAAIYFVTKDYFALGATIVAGFIGVIYTRRKPNKITYELNSRSLGIGQKRYPYSMFKSFSIFREGELTSLNLIPIKRLVPPIAAYFEPQNEQKVIALVGEHLPFEQHKLDAIDRLTRRLRL